ncbi:uncharacterized protein V1518DRAFT_411274 [Limtongia smithiae]|uniref:uncharacterized protein n=1 Tax=Limtongia smithiae TaxID=1125753 RepID=UPI0034CE7E6F
MPLLVEEKFEEISAFLGYSAQLLSAQGDNGSNFSAQLCDKLNSLPSRVGVKVEDPDYYLAEYIVSLLNGLVVASTEDLRKKPDVFSISLGDIKLLNALLDFTVIRCIYSNLSPGVGIPIDRRIKSSTSASKTMRQDILTLVVHTFVSIAETENDVADIIMGGQYATDIISGLCELGFGAIYRGDQSTVYREKFSDFLARIPTYSLLTYTTTLLHQHTPPWFVAVLTRTLAMIPLTRPKDGVQSLIEMIGGLREDEQISVAKLDRAAKILRSVPKGVDAAVYYTSVGTQLLALLDCGDNHLLLSSTVQVINAMNRVAPDVVNNYVFVPITTFFNPSTDSGEEQILVDDITLSRALLRLSQLVRSSESTSIDTLITPIFKSLWALLCFQNQSKRPIELTRSLILVYVKAGNSVTRLRLVIQDISYDGEKDWKYADGDNGEVEIRKRGITYTDLEQENRLKLGEEGVATLSERVSLLMKFVDDLDDSSLRKLFLSIARAWLALRKVPDADPFEVFANLRILEEMLNKHKTKIIESPKEMINLVSTILDEYVEALQDPVDKSKRLSDQLSEITSGLDIDSDDEDEEAEERQSDTETVSIALALITAITSGIFMQNGKYVDSEEQRILKSLVNPLQYMSTHAPPEIASSAATLSILLDNYEMPRTANNADLTESQQKYNNALANIQDELVPIRAHGLHILRSLILERDTTIKVSAVLKIYLSTMNDEDSFIYLNSIKGLQTLTDLHGIYVTEKLVEEYSKNTSQRTLDERLRIGEAILRTIQRLGDALTGKNAEVIMGVVIQMVSTRTLDSRLRMSALSILGMAYEVNPGGILPWIASGIDCALGVLTFETRGDDKAPLRRAAVVLIGSLLKGVNGLNEVPKKLAKEILRIIKYVRISDDDPLVRVQAGNVLDILETMLRDAFTVPGTSIGPRVFE